jgi:hypothetical protein
MSGFRLSFKLFSGLLAAFALSSCATLMNSRKINVNLKVPANVVITEVEKTIKKHNDQSYVVYRSDDSLRIHVKVKDSSMVLAVPAKKSFIYWYNIFTLGVGFIPDHYTTKKFAYPRRLIIKNENGALVIMPYHRPFAAPSTSKGIVQLLLYFPWLNNFNVVTGVENNYRNTGFIGLGAGAEYFFKDRQSILISASTAINNEIPIPIPIDYFSGRPPYINSKNVNVSRNHYWKCFSVAYGLHYSENAFYSWDSTYTVLVPETMLNNYHYLSKGLGPSFSMKFHTLRKFYAGFTYYPMLLSLSAKPLFKYQALLSFEVGMKIRLRK